MPRSSLLELTKEGIPVEGLDPQFNWGLPMTPTAQLVAMPLVTDLSILQYRSASAWMGSVTTQATMGAFAHNVGIPLASAYKEVMKSVLAPIQDQLREITKEIREQILQVTEQALKAMVDQVLEALEPMMDAIATIPVYGWVMEIIWNVAKLVRTMVQMAKDVPSPEVEYRIPQYSSQTDTTAFNAMLAIVRGSLDWTPLFAPSGVGPGKGIGAQARFGVINYEGKALGIVPMGAAPGGLAFGMVPGVARVLQSAILPSTLMETGMGTVTDSGTLLPQIEAQHAYLWKQMSRYTQKTDAPALYFVDAKKLEAWWGQYVWDFWNFLKGFDVGNKVMAQIGFYYNQGQQGERGPFFGMFDNKNRLKKPSESAVQDILCVKECSILRKRQMAFLDTIMVAYLDRDMAALAGDQDLRKKWNQRKGELLKHPARCKVSLDDVRDTIYLQYLQESNLSAAACSAFPLAGAPAFKVPARLPSGNPGSGLPGPGKGARRRKMSPLVPLAAAGAAAYFFFPKVFK